MWLRGFYRRVRALLRSESIHEEIDEEMLRVEEGSLYPALYRLEERGWIASDWGVSENNRRARFYRLTAAGRRQLGVEEEGWRLFVQAVGKVMQSA